MSMARWDWGYKSDKFSIFIGVTPIAGWFSVENPGKKEEKCMIWAWSQESAWVIKYSRIQEILRFDKDCSGSKFWCKKRGPSSKNLNLNPLSRECSCPREQSVWVHCDSHNPRSDRTNNTSSHLQHINEIIEGKWWTTELRKTSRSHVVHENDGSPYYIFPLKRRVSGSVDPQGLPPAPSPEKNRACAASPEAGAAGTSRVMIIENDYSTHSNNSNNNNKKKKKK